MGVTIASSSLPRQQVCSPGATGFDNALFLLFYLEPRPSLQGKTQTVFNSIISYFGEAIHQSVCRALQKQTRSNQISFWFHLCGALLTGRKKGMDALCLSPEGEREKLWGFSHASPFPEKLPHCRSGAVCDAAARLMSRIAGIKSKG